MARKRAIEVLPPYGGLSKELAYQSQAPYTSTAMTDVRPHDTLEGRLRFSSRPGTVKSFPDASPFPLGTGSPIRMMAVMRSLNDSGQATFSEPFDDNPMSGSNWSTASWAADGLFDTSVTSGQGHSLETEHRAAILASKSINTSALQTVSVQLDQVGESAGPGDNSNPMYIKLIVGLDDTTPDEASSVALVFEINRNSGTNVYYLYIAKNGGESVGGVVGADVISETQPSFSFQSSLAISGWLRFHVLNGVFAIAVWDPTSSNVIGTVMSAEADISALTFAGQRVGVEVKNTKGSVNSVIEFFDTKLNLFSFQHTLATGGVPPESIVAASGGNIYYETTEGTMALATMNSMTVASDKPLQAVDRLGKLYIADNGIRTESTSSNLGETENGSDPADSLRFTTTNPDWTTLGIETAGDLCEILSYATAGTAFNGTYRIKTVNTNNIVLATEDGTTSPALTALTGVVFRVFRAPKVFDTDNFAVTLWTPTFVSGSNGDMPANWMPNSCPAIEVFRDRIVMGGDPEFPGLWFMSRAGDPLDWAFGSATNPRQAAVAGTSTTQDAGSLAVPISAIVAVNEDYMLISSETELYLMRGDPAQGGVLDNMSRQVGIGALTAWCRTPDGKIYFLARDGVYFFIPGNALPQPVSQKKLPRDFLGLVIRDSNNLVSMEYDAREMGIHIFVTPDNETQGNHWWYSLRTDGFFPVKLAADHAPHSVAFDAKLNRVLMGCADGYIRNYQAGIVDDDGTSITSSVTLGPFRLGVNSLQRGAIQELVTVMDEQSGDAVIDIYTGDTPEAALVSASRGSRTVSSGLNNSYRPRFGGGAMFIKISDSSGSQWALDRLSVVIQSAGLLRK